LQVATYVDENAELLRSMKEERQMLLAHRDRLRAAMHQILELADGHDDAEETLIAIANLAVVALAL
jgi:hypothetical protein